MKIAIVTGGGDCPGLNAVIRAVVRTGCSRGWEVLGILGGYEGLLPPVQSRVLDLPAVAGLLSRGGTILGSVNRGLFTAKVGCGESRKLPVELLEQTKHGMNELDIAALVVAGGDGTLSIAQQMHEYGIPIVGIPKTIDNDVTGTLMTVGFDSAVACAAEALDRLHTTAESHNRVMVLEVMGRYAGWIALYSGVAGGADVILMPEIPYSYDVVCAKILERERRGRRFSIVVVAEGARERGTEYVTSGSSIAAGEIRLGGVGALVASEIEKRTKKESRCCVLGHLQRGGGPSMLDRTLSSNFGAEAVERVAAGDFGKMVAYHGGHITAIPIHEAVGKLKTVPPDGSLTRTARALGICFGD